MNSHQAAAAAKNELPIKCTYANGEQRVFRRIKALTYHYFPKKGVSVLLDDRSWSQCNIWVSLDRIETIDNCDVCPDKGKGICGACIFSKPAPMADSKETDNFTCKNCSSCPNFKNECKGWNDGKICIRYGECAECMNNDESICCEICVHRKNTGVEDDDE